MEQKLKHTPSTPANKNETFVVKHEEEFPTRRALEELNEATRNHYVTKHGGGTETHSSTPQPVGPMDHEA